MPGRNAPLDEYRIIRDLMRREGVHMGALNVQLPVPAKNSWTVASTPATTYTLSFLPIQPSINLSLNGVELLEGTDYTVAYTTGVITVSATLKGTPTPADVLSADYWTNGDLIAATSVADVGFTGDPSGWAIVSNQAKAMSVAYSNAYLVSAATYNTVQVTIQSSAGANPPEIAAAYNPSSGDWCGVIVSGLCNLAFVTAGGSSFLPLLGGGGPVFPSRWTVSYSSSGVLGVNYETLVGGVWTSQGSQVFTATTAQRTYLDGLQDVMIRAGQNTLLDDFSCGPITDSFNRPDQTGLGTTDTGQNWNYNP